MEVNLKDNIWIDGRDDESASYALRDFRILQGVNILYFGKINEVPEILAKEICIIQSLFDNKEYIDKNIDRYLNYSINEFHWFDCTAIQSIKSACNKEFCIIYKK